MALSSQRLLLQLAMMRQMLRNDRELQVFAALPTAQRMWFLQVLQLIMQLTMMRQMLQIYRELHFFAALPTARRMWFLQILQLFMRRQMVSIALESKISAGLFRLARISMSWLIKPTDAI